MFYRFSCRRFRLAFFLSWESAVLRRLTFALLIEISFGLRHSLPSPPKPHFGHEAGGAWLWLSWSLRYRADLSWRKPKNRGPFHLVPVITWAIFDRLS
jgi:hypothetical protein